MARTKKPALVWRLEDRHGEGVYQSSEFIPDDCEVYRLGSNPKRPGPIQDAIPAQPYSPKMLGPFILPNSGGYFGFASIEQARAWFDHPEDIREWSGLGLFLSAYAGAAIRRPYVTPHQVAFLKPEGVTPILRLPAAALYDLEPEALERKAKEAFKHAHV